MFVFSARKLTKDWSVVEMVKKLLRMTLKFEREMVHKLVQDYFKANECEINTVVSLFHLSVVKGLTSEFEGLKYLTNLVCH